MDHLRFQCILLQVLSLAGLFNAYLKGLFKDLPSIPFSCCLVYSYYRKPSRLLTSELLLTY